MKGKRSSTSTLVVIIATIIGVAIVGGLLKEYRSPKVSFESLLLRASMEVNKTCPHMFSDDVRLDYTVAGPGNLFEYYFTFTDLDADLMEQVELDKRIHSALRYEIETNKGLEIFKENGVTLVFNTKDKNGVTVSRIEVTPADYNNYQSNK